MSLQETSPEDQVSTSLPEDEDPYAGYTHVIPHSVYFAAFAMTNIIPFLIVLLIFTKVVQFYYVPSGSMLPTLSIGEVVLCTQIDAPGDVKRGDIVVFSPYTPENNYLDLPESERKELYVKRLIGLPGDRVAIQEHILYVNGQPQTEPYLPPDLEMVDFGEITVPEGCYFMMGDNRNNSADSRFIGSIPFENLKAHCFFHLKSIPGILHHSSTT